MEFDRPGVCSPENQHKLNLYLKEKEKKYLKTLAVQKTCIFLILSGKHVDFIYFFIKVHVGPPVNTKYKISGLTDVSKK